MKRFFLSARSLWQKRSQESRKSSAANFRPTLECLEDRVVPTAVTNPHNGPVMPKVEVQALYLGSDWYSNMPSSQPALNYFQLAETLDLYLQSIVNSSYMDMLSNAGYGVGRGSDDPGHFANVNLNKNAPLTDGSIQQYLQSYVNNGTLKPTDANRLFVVYVEDNVVVQVGKANSVNAFLGYHSSFTGHNASGKPETFQYAVIAYPGGSAGNNSLSWLSTFDTLTVVTSHELAEAVTDPYDTSWNGGSADTEVGDLAANSTVYLPVSSGSSYSVQRIADQQGQAMTPVGATGKGSGNFVLAQGNLYSVGYGQLAGENAPVLASGVARISDEGIDQWGSAMIDVVMTNGSASEYHAEWNTWTPLGNTGIQDAKAGQGVSYVLGTNGSLWEYREANQTWTQIQSSGVASIDAGTDRYGANEVAFVTTSGYAYNFSDSTGLHYLWNGVKSVSAGQEGRTAVVFQSANAYTYVESSGAWNYVASGVSQMTMGTDQVGNAEIELLFGSGALDQWRVDTGWTQQQSGGVQMVSKAHAGNAALVFQGGRATQWNYSSFTDLAELGGVEVAC
jgi:hypothetical protein